MLKIKSIKKKVIYEVCIEYDNDDGKGPQNITTQVEKLSDEKFSAISYEDNFVIEGTYRNDENFSDAVNQFLKNQS